MKHSISKFAALLVVLAMVPSVGAQPEPAHPPLRRGELHEPSATKSTDYEYKETRELVQLVKDAADLVRLKGQEAFTDLRAPGSRWRQEETYIFVLDPKGNMLVHLDATMEGKNQLDLKDVNGKPIIRGLIDAATSVPNKPEGWYHYEWPVPGGLLPRWKSAYVRLVVAPPGNRYIVGSGMYNDQMERTFVVDSVKAAVAQIEKNGEAAFELFRDRTGPFMAKDAYIFVIDPNGVDLVNPAFPNLQGRNNRDLKDTQGKYLIRDMLKIAQTTGSGWVDYMWPKPGESVPTQKSTYVSKANLGGQRSVIAPTNAPTNGGQRSVVAPTKSVIVGCGVYLADAPTAVETTKKMTAPELMALVRDGAAVLEKQGAKAYPAFREKGSRWFRDDTYFLVRTMDETIVFHAADREMEGRDMRGVNDVLGRPYGRMFLEAATSPTGEGWVHYMYPEPGDIFPAWKSTFVKRVTFPSGKQHIIGCGIYHMQMNNAFIEDLVNRASALVAQRGKDAFAQLRDKTGPFLFMDTYVFVNTPDGTELVNPAQPSLEGRNLNDVRDVKGKRLVREYIDLAIKQGSAWVDYYWYKPGQNTPAQKHSYVKKVQFADQTYIVGAGFYAPGGQRSVVAPTPSVVAPTPITKFSWDAVETEKISDRVSLQKIFGEKATLARYSFKQGDVAAVHSHASEEYMWVTSGALQITFGDRELILNPGEVLVIPPDVPHSITAPQQTASFHCFAPARQDWLRGEDAYLRKPAAATVLSADEQTMAKIQKYSWATVEKEKIPDHLTLQKIFGDNATLAQYSLEGNAPSLPQHPPSLPQHAAALRHSHPSEEYMWVTSGALQYTFDDRQITVNPGEVLVIPPNLPHSVMTPQDTVAVGFFAPSRQDWLRGDDEYLRGLQKTGRN